MIPPRCGFVFFLSSARPPANAPRVPRDAYSTGALVLLENPEAHLHPKGQAQIGRLLAKAAAAGVQVVAETHSDHVLNGIRVAVHDNLIPADKISIHFFTRSGNADGMCTNVVSPRMYPDGRIDEWPEGFFDEWDRNLEALLAPKET